MEGSGLCDGRLRNLPTLDCHQIGHYEHRLTRIEDSNGSAQMTTDVLPVISVVISVHLWQSLTKLTVVRRDTVAQLCKPRLLSRLQKPNGICRSALSEFLSATEGHREATNVAALIVRPGRTIAVVDRMSLCQTQLLVCKPRRMCRMTNRPGGDLQPFVTRPQDR